VAAPSPIKDLVDRFTQNIGAYKGNNYNETRARIEFIDPFFNQLGWDINNTQGFAEAYKDVIHEDAIKVEGSTKAPDYSFRIGGQRKFFLEAKKPSVNVKDDIAPAYQLRRYAWNAGLPVSILTDFEEFAIYDTTIRPNVKDKASTARIFYCTYDEYEKHWDYIASIFSKDAILKGSFDHFLKDSKKKKGTTAVDKEFLKEMEEWRTDLAKNIALRNTIDIHPLNYVVQATIDRILFLRICEDRNIEEYGRLQKLAAGTQIYKQLTKFFEQADEKYNSGLFHFHKEKGVTSAPDEISLNLKIDDKILKDIITALYYPSPYEFSVISADILGNVYEQFLGKVIRLTSGGQAKVEEKPEVKKAGGVYYTPQYIVKYIVENTVGELLKEKTPMMVAGKVKGHSPLRILDPACGSGSFLIYAYQYLLDWHRDWYEKDIKQKGAAQAKKWNDAVYQGPGDHWYLTTREKKRILVNSIFGVDIDHQAVEVTKLNLLLKVLEGENRETLGTNLKLFQERALPDLAENIKCGNSLIGSDFYSLTPSPSPRGRGGQQALFEMPDEEKYKINAFDWDKEFPGAFAVGGFDAVIGNPPYGAELGSTERVYLENKFSLGTTDTAALMMAQQQILLKDNGLAGYIVPKAFTYASNWRKVRTKLLPLLQSIADVSKVWPEVKLEMTTYILAKRKFDTAYRIFNRKESEIYQIGTIQKEDCNIFDFILSGITPEELSIAKSTLSRSSRLGEVILNQRGAMLQSAVVPKGKGFSALGGKNISRYGAPLTNKGVIPREIVTDEKALIKPNSVLVQNIVAHIMNPIDHIQIIATVIDNKDDYVILDTINQLSNKSSYPAHLILAIINSKFINWYVYRFIFARAIRTMHFDSPVTDRIPFPKEISPAKTKQIAALVGQLLSLGTRAASNTLIPAQSDQLQRQIGAIDREIDKLVYELYGLTDDEIKIVEGAG
jgi:type I restriction-modification system DNA methylase subunit